MCRSMPSHNAFGVHGLSLGAWRYDKDLHARRNEPIKGSGRQFCLPIALTTRHLAEETDMAAREKIWHAH